MRIRLADIANQATMLAANPAMSKAHVEDLLEISCDAASLMAHMRAERQEIDRALKFMLEKQVASSVCATYIFPPARNQ